MEPPPNDNDSGPGDPVALTSLHVRRAIDGSDQSLSWVVERLSPLLIAEAEYRLGPRLRTHYDPQDLVHDTWLVALPKLGSLPERDGRFTPVLLRFLSTTLLHRVRNLLRKHITRPIRQVSAASATSQDPTDEGSGVITKAIRAERRSQVLDALRELEDIDREILLLRGIEQISNDAVCSLLGLTKSAVSMRYRRALERLRAHLPGSVFDELAPGDDD